MRFLAALAALFVALPAFAQSVSMSVSVATLEVEQTSRISLVVSGVEPLGFPIIEPVDGLSIRELDRRVDFSSSPGSSITRTYRYSYTVSALEAGDYTIGPVSVGFPGGKSLNAGPVSLKVVERGRTFLPADQLSATATFSPDVAWEGQVVLYRAELTARIPIQSVGWSFPDFQGLLPPTHGTASQSQTQIGDPTGNITILRQVQPLIATGTGDRSQPPAVAQVNVPTGQRNFIGTFTTRRRPVPTEGRAALTVRPLPSPPPGFSGLVGEFQIASKLDKQRAVVGESVSWIVTVVGEGITDNFLYEPPAIPGARTYKGENDVVGRLIDDQYVGSKSFRLTLVPTDPGTLEVPPLEVVVFSPIQGKYVTLNAPVGTLQVTGEGESVTVVGGTETAVSPLDDAPPPIDLVGVYTYGFADAPPFAAVAPLFLMLLSFPAGLVLMREGGQAMRGRLEARKQRKVESVKGAKRLAGAPKDGPARLAVFDLALREALAARVGVEVGQLQRASALATLEGVTWARVSQAFDLLDRVRFAGGEMSDDVEAAVKAALKALS